MRLLSTLRFCSAGADTHSPAVALRRTHSCGKPSTEPALWLPASECSHRTAPSRVNSPASSPKRNSMDSWQCHWRVLKVYAVCSLQFALSRSSETLPSPHKASNGEWRTEQLPRKAIAFKLAPTGATSHLRGTVSLRNRGSKDFIGRLLLCLLHSACRPWRLRELLDVPLDSHSVVLWWACTATTQTSGRAPVLTEYRHQADHCHRCKAWQLALAGHNRDGHAQLPQYKPVFTLYGKQSKIS